MAINTCKDCIECIYEELQIANLYVLLEYIVTFQQHMKILLCIIKAKNNL